MHNASRRGLAVGFFDGVHLGHQAILRGASAALTFRNHPLSVLAPERAPRLVMSAEERIAAMRACGVGEVIVLDFTKELAQMPAREFALRHLADPAWGGVVRCGGNWRFGRGGEGDAALLRSLGLAVEVLPYAVHDGGRISSTRIRGALECGEMEDASAMLGRDWTAHGEVFKGKGFGAGLGFPTVNVLLEGVSLELRRGVYEVFAAGCRAIANYGVAPTFGDMAWKRPVLEMHFTGEVPSVAEGESVEVAFHRFVRPERRFSSPEELKRQIESDVRG